MRNIREIEGIKKKRRINQIRKMEKIRNIA